MPVGKAREWMLPGTFFALLTLAAGGVGAWVDVKTDIATNDTKIEDDRERETERYQRLEEKVDQILDHLLQQKRDE